MLYHVVQMSLLLTFLLSCKHHMLLYADPFHDVKWCFLYINQICLYINRSKSLSDIPMVYPVNKVPGETTVFEETRETNPTYFKGKSTLSKDTEAQWQDVSETHFLQTHEHFMLKLNLCVRILQSGRTVAGAANQRFSEVPWRESTSSARWRSVVPIFRRVHRKVVQSKGKSLPK